MKKIILIFLIIFSGTAFAIDTFQISDLNLLSINPVELSLIGMNKTDENISVQLVVDSNVDGRVFDQNFLFDANESKVIGLSPNLLSIGSHDLIFTAVHPEDTDQNNNTLSIVVDIPSQQDLPNLIVTSFTLSNREPEVGEEMDIFFSVKNSSNVNIDRNFLIGVFIDGNNIFTKPVNGLSSGSFSSGLFTHTFTQEDAEFFEIKADYTNSVTESDEADNSKKVFLTFIDGVDLTITGADISHTTPKLNSAMTFTLLFMNIGNLDAANIRIFGYINEVVPDNLIYDRTFQLLRAGQDLNTFFQYTPTTPGFKQLTIIIDPNNTLEELNENNNQTTSGFTVPIPTEEDQDLISKTLIFEISEECAAFLSNGHQLISGGILEKVPDENTSIDETEYELDLKLFDSLGVSLLDGKFGSGTEVGVPGATLRVLDVSEFAARVLLIYQQDVSTNFNSCILDVRRARQDADYYLEQFQDCQEILTRETLESNELLGEKTGKQIEIDTCRTELSSCTTQKGDLQINVQEAVNSCGQRVDSALDTVRDERETERNITIQSNQTEKNLLMEKNRTLEGEINLIYLVAAIAFAGAGGILIYRFKKKQEVLY